MIDVPNLTDEEVVDYVIDRGCGMRDSRNDCPALVCLTLVSIIGCMCM